MCGLSPAFPLFYRDETHLSHQKNPQNTAAKITPFYKNRMQGSVINLRWILMELNMCEHNFIDPRQEDVVAPA